MRPGADITTVTPELQAQDAWLLLGAQRVAQAPVLDAHGKLVGLAFDGNWESVASNWVFDPSMSRMISVDQRYMRWIMQEVMPAPQLLKEMGVAPKK